MLEQTPKMIIDDGEDQLDVDAGTVRRLAASCRPCTDSGRSARQGTYVATQVVLQRRRELDLMPLAIVERERVTGVAFAARLCQARRRIQSPAQQANRFLHLVSW